jgi:hypothetical protein
VEYYVPANFIGSEALVFNQNNPLKDGTSDVVELNTDLLTIYPVSAVDGSITVVAPVPEPAAWLLAAIGAASLGIVGRCWRGRA